MASRPDPPVQRQRLSLGSSRRRFKYEQRIRLWLTAFTLPMVVGAALLAYQQSRSLPLSIAAAALVALIGAIACAYFFEQLIRPLQTLSNVVAALREDDFSFRARGASRGDSLGDLALEINALASTLQTQRSAARDALTLVERVMTSMQSPVLAFDAAGHLRLMNPAAQQAFHLRPKQSIGVSAQQLQLETLLATGDEGLYASANPLTEPSSANVRWSVRRTTFRLQGVSSHTFCVV